MRHRIACAAAAAACGLVVLTLSSCAADFGSSVAPRTPVIFTSGLGETVAGPVTPAPEAQVTPRECPRRATPIAAPVASGMPIALTFDDGPSPGLTERLLEVLASRGAKATFFVTGSSAERAPDLVRAVAASGSVVGNHSYNHPYMDELSPDEMDWQIAHTNEVIAQITGARPTWMRPPYGRRGNGVAEVIRRCDMRTAMWTADPKDWEPGTTPERITATVLGAARPRGIILLHEREATLAALPEIIDGLQAAGYRLVTLDEL